VKTGACGTRADNSKWSCQARRENLFGW